MIRWILFLLCIIVGVALGLVYGWRIEPVEYTNTAPNTLRIDYKTDYVLMVAETYNLQKDPAQALQQLSFLGSIPPLETVSQALLFAEQQGYSAVDFGLMQSLLSDLQTRIPYQNTPAP